ncbi:MAG: DUF4350 domain-containing protein, partial [Actinomycetota bacterium]|nr:DUF4350 domain-containing protein [Actinomycetota bacterium]
TSPKGPHGAPLDPTSTSPQGAKALASLIAALGGRVDTSGRLPAIGHGVALVLDDQLTGADRSRVEAWVAAGGTLVVADPTSTLVPMTPAASGSPAGGVTTGGTYPRTGSTVSPRCGAPWVAAVAAVRIGPADTFRGPTDSSATTCFPSQDGFFALEAPVGQGTVVALAGPQLWTNQALGLESNSVLAADLLVSSPGATVAWLGATVSLLGSGHASLWSLTGPRVRELLVGLLVAAVVVATWRSRRLGRPISEPATVPLPGSSHVAAVGRLLARDRQAVHASQVLRRELVNELAAFLGVGRQTPLAVLANLAAVRTGTDEAALLEVLTDGRPLDESGLVELAARIQTIRQETLIHAQQPAR